MNGAGRSYQYLSASCTHVGMIRKLNEDACLDRPDLGLWAVADGMGGHDAGDLASRLVVESLSRIPPPVNAPSFLAQAKLQLAEANRSLRAEATAQGSDRIIASTVVVLLTYNHHFACIWAGDSRLYLWRATELRQITRDHSHVQELVDIGVLTPEEAGRHPQANVVTRAVGATDSLEFEMRHERILPADLFLLCSDGLTKMLSDREIAEVLARTSTTEAAEALVGVALERGASDNVTTVVIQCRGSGAA
ncbi:protein phosphatase 2C domain-containing protein [Rhodospirillaceae bacterium SYSU D60014]|uniref:PP2C family protein-serine/threonine phosphatase n=1 Tax=Virgifigura deserti TaxID=2268457 RepID=UPI000E66387E